MMSCISSVITYDDGGSISSAQSSYHPPDYDSDCNSIYSGYGNSKTNNHYDDDDDEDENETNRVLIRLGRRQDSRLVSYSKKECGVWRRNQHRQELHQNMSRAVAEATQSDYNPYDYIAQHQQHHTCCGEYCFHAAQSGGGSRAGCTFCKNCHACKLKERHEKERKALDKQRVENLLQQTQSRELQKLLFCWMEGQRPSTTPDDLSLDDNMNDVRERLRDFGGGGSSNPRVKKKQQQQQQLSHRRRRHHHLIIPQQQHQKKQKQMKRKRRIMTCSNTTTTATTTTSNTLSTSRDSKARRMIKIMKKKKEKEHQQQKKKPRTTTKRLQRGHYQQRKKDGRPPRLVVLDYAAKPGASDYVPPGVSGGFDDDLLGSPSNEYIPPGFGGDDDDETFYGGGTGGEEEKENQNYYYNQYNNNNNHNYDYHQERITTSRRRKRKETNHHCYETNDDLKVQRMSSYLQQFLFCFGNRSRSGHMSSF